MIKDDVVAIILGGGQGSRLYLLTEKRSKPAVPIAGKYRLVDIPSVSYTHLDVYKRQSQIYCNGQYFKVPI